MTTFTIIDACSHPISRVCFRRVVDGRSRASGAYLAQLTDCFRTSCAAIISLDSLCCFSYFRFCSSPHCCICLVDVFGVKQCMSQRLFPRRPSQIFNPHVNFVLTGSGSAIALQHTILLFLTDPDTTGNLDIGRLSQVSVNCFRVTVTWRQVDTPSVASVASLPSLDFHISDDEF